VYFCEVCANGDVENLCGGVGGNDYVGPVGSSFSIVPRLGGEEGENGGVLNVGGHVSLEVIDALVVDDGDEVTVVIITSYDGGRVASGEHNGDDGVEIPSSNVHVVGVEGEPSNGESSGEGSGGR